MNQIIVNLIKQQRKILGNVGLISGRIYETIVIKKSFLEWLGN
jgi:hypothetical protein